MQKQMIMSLNIRLKIGRHNLILSTLVQHMPIAYPFLNKLQKSDLFYYKDLE